MVLSLKSRDQVPMQTLPAPQKHQKATGEVVKKRRAKIPAQGQRTGLESGTEFPLVLGKPERPKGGSSLHYPLQVLLAGCEGGHPSLFQLQGLKDEGADS